MTRKSCQFVFGLITCAPMLLHAAQPDIIIGDFEGKDYRDWTTSGEAFGSAPAPGTLPNQMPVTGFLGHGLANSFHGGDSATGVVTSAEFVIQRKYITFRIGGGGWDGRTCINLWEGGKLRRTATGMNTRSGGSEELVPGLWEVSGWRNRTGRVEIVDSATGTWGHINVDQIIQTDVAPEGFQFDASREITVQKRYLNLPVKTGAPIRRVSVVFDGQITNTFDIELADGTPDFWTFLDLESYQGKRAVIKASWLTANSRGLESIEQSDEIKGGENLYQEASRPQFHFSSRCGWLNDPNGLVFSQGEYHLYYQHNPYGWKWGNMHWGHAVSADLVHWKELPIALYPKRYGDSAFSGSAVVDKNNTAGFKTGKQDVIVAAYTSTARGECILYSNDGGRTFTEYAGNPVIKHQGRDPRLLWHEPTAQWVMAVYDEDPSEPNLIKRRSIVFYTSPDLKQWTKQSRVGGFYECPDFFELPVDGDAKSKKWVLSAASSEYMVGSFDGKTFTPETTKLPGHRGAAYYAAQTYSDIPARDGRRIQIGWSQCATPDMPFNQMMSFPSELMLRTTSEGVRLFYQPVKEIKKLYGKGHSWIRLTMEAKKNPLAAVKGDLLDINAELRAGDADEVDLLIRGVPVRYNFKNQQIMVDGRSNSLPMVDGKVSLRILVDRTSLEIYGNDGQLFMPLPVNPSRWNTKAQSLAVSIKGGAFRVSSLQVHELKSAWTK